MKYFVLVLVLFFSCLAQASNSSFDWNKECADDIGLTVEQSFEKYGGLSIYHDIEEPEEELFEEYTLEDLQNMKNAFEQGLKTPCMIIVKEFTPPYRFDYVIDNFDHVELNYEDFKKITVVILKKTMDLISRKSSQTEAFHISSSN